MGRKAKPVDLIVMEGKTHLTKAEIDARKKREIKPNTENVKCPDWLCDVGREEWNRIEPDLIELGLLTNIDVNILAIYCDAYAKYIEASQYIQQHGMVMEYENKNGVVNLVANPYVAVANKYSTIIKKYCEEFGLTPTSRAKISIPKKAASENETSNSRVSGLL